MKLAAIVLAAGKGTRMKSARPKVLHEAAGRELIAYPIELARGLGAERIVCVLGHGGGAVRAAIEARFGEGAVAIALQEEQRGTGDAVARALPSLGGFDGPALILYGDVPLLTAGLLEELVAKSRGKRLGLVTARLADPTGYGRIVRDSKGRLARIVEQKDASAAERALEEINAGIYCVASGFLREAL